MVIVSGIYIIRNKKNDKIYIGQAQNISKRWGEHRRTLESGKHTNRHLQFAWNKYGAGSFEFKVLERCAIDQLDKREQHYLDIYISKGICYNINPSAKTTRGMKCSDETKHKISIARTGKAINENVRQKISHALKGRKLNDNQHKAIVESNKNRIISDKVKQQFSELLRNQKGAKHTPERIKRKSEAMLQEFIVTSPNGEEIHIRGLVRFCRENGLDQGTMSRAMKLGRTHKGWKCRKVN